jgi:hypothetical protein
LITTSKAEFYIGLIYYQGKLVSRDLVEAAARCHIAASQKFEGAQSLLDQIESEMSSAQKEAERSRFETLEKSFEQAKMTEEATKKGKEFTPWAGGGA